MLSGNGEFAARGRRSYESRRRGKEASVDNAVATGSDHGIFATENSTVVVAQIGGTATLPCVVRKFNNGVVSGNTPTIALDVLALIAMVSTSNTRLLFASSELFLVSDAVKLFYHVLRFVE